MKGLGMSIQEVCEGERTGFCVFNSESGSLACFSKQCLSVELSALSGRYILVQVLGCGDPK